MATPCPLCHAPSMFSSPAHLHTSLTSLTRGPVICPVPFCGYPATSLDSLILHLASHTVSVGVIHKTPQSDNIEQVIRDLEDLVDSEIDCVEPQSVSAVSGESWPHVMAGLAPLPSWSCSQMQSSQSYQLYQTCQSLSNQVAATTSLSSLSPSQYPAPELSPSHYLESVTSLSSPPSHHTQAQLIGKL